jgi:hypothetical protein
VCGTVDYYPGFIVSSDIIADAGLYQSLSGAGKLDPQPAR